MNYEGMSKKELKEYVKRQVKYFRKRHAEVPELKEKLRYSNNIYYWETRLKDILEGRKRK